MLRMNNGENSVDGYCIFVLKPKKKINGKNHSRLRILTNLESVLREDRCEKQNIRGTNGINN